MTIAERLRFILEADVSDAQRGFEKLGRSADDNLTKAETHAERMSANFTRAGAAMLAAGGLAAAGLVRAAEKTGALETQMYRVDRVFGESADQVDAFAKGAAESMGMSQRAAAEMAVELGRIGQKAGVSEGELAGFSRQWATIVGDAAAFAGADPSEVIAAIGATTRGEYDSLERFGGTLTAAKVEAYALEHGLISAGQAMTDQVRVTATLALVQQDLAFSQGTLADRAADGALATQQWAAEWENFQAKLGEKVLPMMRDLVGVGSDVLGFVSGLDDATGGMVATMATWTTGLLLAGGAVSSLIGYATNSESAIGRLVTKFGAGKVAAAAFGAAIVAVVATKVWDDWHRQEQMVDDMTVSLQQALRAGTDFATWIQSQADASGFLIEKFDELNLSTTEMADAARAGGERWEEYKRHVLEAGDEAGLTVVDLVALQHWLDSVASSADNVTVGVAEMNGEFRVGARGLKETSANLEGMAKAADTTRRKVNDLDLAFAGLLDLLDQEDLVRDAQRGFDDLAEAAVTAYLAAQQGSADAEQAARDYEQAIDDQKRKVIDYAQEVGNLPVEWVTEIVALIDEQKFAEAEARFAQLGKIQPLLSPSFYSGGKSTPGPPDLSGLGTALIPHASGGSVTPGRGYLVGEQGPEPFFPMVPGTIIPNGALGGTVTNHVTINMPAGSNGEDVVQAIERYVRGNGPIRVL